MEKNPYVDRVNERRFLNLPGFHGGAYVVAYVEDSSGRELEKYESARFILEMADCSNDVNFEIDISSAMQRQNSFHKIDTLIETLQQFRQGMVAECALQRGREQARREEKERKAAAERENNERPRRERHSGRTRRRARMDGATQ